MHTHRHIITHKLTHTLKPVDPQRFLKGLFPKQILARLALSCLAFSFYIFRSWDTHVPWHEYAGQWTTCRKSVLSFRHPAPTDLTQVASLGIKRPYSLSHLASSSLISIYIDVYLFMCILYF